jgi:hypothetical protein
VRAILYAAVAMLIGVAALTLAHPSTGRPPGRAVTVGAR